MSDEISRLNQLVNDTQAQLSSKSQECEELKKLYSTYTDGPVIDPLYADNGELCGYSLISRDTGETLCSEEDAETIEYLRAENERLKTTLVAGAELIKENWDKICDEEGYGPQNLLLRMDGTLNTSGYPGYSSGEFEKLRKRCEDMEAILDNNGLSWTYKNLSQ